MPLVLLGGINRVDTVRAALADGFEFVQMGRALLREPDLVARWQKGDDHESLCIHCNKCMSSLPAGAGGVPGYVRSSCASTRKSSLPITEA